MSISRPIALIFRRKWLLSRFWRSASQCWQLQKARAIGLAVFLVVLVLLQLLVQLLLNLWNRNFFDALGRKDAHTLWIQAQLFVPLAVMSILLASASVWGRMTAQRSWREALTRKVMSKWLENDRFRHLDHLAKGSENPEYRIAFDIRMATDSPIDFAVALLSSVLTSITFFAVLWTIGGSIQFVLLGVNVVIPGYLMFGVILYAVTVSGFMLVWLAPHRSDRAHEPSRSRVSFRNRRLRQGNCKPESLSRRWRRTDIAAQAASGVALVARNLLTTCPNDDRFAWQHSSCTGGRVASLRTEISQWCDVVRRAHASRGCIRRTARGFQLAC
jgi:vitamin B12/bleomycin/antimicrobial peptide transport system ATP-binding/permease protein